ncbi:protein delta homolog 2 [Pyxicephalus adspersus]|uniref:Protein delta homolog 2 n=1 Tax=Pyxicephalus adspersus TaxID=30357 RepID=A0AAV3AYV4_PYXAD|nr:TPA: hypothetical protein GDO54_011566 [Pyxicephalus adspersus]
MLGCSPVLLFALCWVLFTYWTSVKAEECAELCDLYHGHCDQDGVCRCDPGWDGPYCEDCVRMPGCIHGVCHQPWQCMCQSGWAGNFCDKGEWNILSRDMKFPCLNGGTCHDENGFADALTCRCLAGYVGRLCETDVDDCLMRPCANGATCIDGVNRFSCECPYGFQGRFCTVNIDDCVGQPCHNGGRCFDRVGDYECYCAEGFTGKSCEVPIPKSTWEYQVGTSAREPTTQTQPTRTVGTSRWNPVSVDKAGHFKISVKEVVTQREPGLSQLQLIIVIVFGVITGLVVLLTVALVLWYRRRGCGQPGWCSSSEDTKTRYEQCHGTVPENRKTTEL